MHINTRLCLACLGSVIVYIRSRQFESIHPRTACLLCNAMSYYYTRTRINAQHYRDEADEPQVYLIRPVLGNPYLAPGVLGLPIICIVTNVNSLIQYAGGEQSPRLEICNYSANWHEATCFILTPGEFIVDYFLFFLGRTRKPMKI